MNDRADLCLAAGFDGVHVGQDDLSPEGARKSSEKLGLGVSTHNPEQVAQPTHLGGLHRDRTGVFDRQQANPDPVVGLDGVRQARALTRKPLVAIGGITRANAAR